MMSVNLGKSVYISGPMTGFEDLNKQAFYEARDLLLEKYKTDYIVVPHDLPAANNVELSWSDYLIRDICFLMGCKAVLMLRGWELSKGARLERHIAIELGIPVHYIWEI